MLTSISWVFGSSLPQSTTNGHTVYTPSGSATNTSLTWDISYKDGSSASGNVYKDFVTIGDYTVHQQAVEVASQVSSSFAQEPSDGLMGLSFSSANTVSPTKQQTWFDNIKGQLDSPLFAVSLKHNAPGSYDFGYLDHSKYTGDITYTPVDSSQGYWGFTASGYTIGSGQPVTSNIQGIAGKLFAF